MDTDHEALMEDGLVEGADDEVPESEPSALLLASKGIGGVRCGYDDEKGEGEEDSDDGRFWLL